jgi:protocatechuate 3,4-dioxygenase beta subunit
MQDLDENTVTDAALEQMAGTPDPRLKAIMEAAVRHLHAFAREVNLTPAEWIEGIRFLTEVGHSCSPVRQEFILLSDVLGLSALVNALHDRTVNEKGTRSSLLGPFFRQGAPEYALGESIIKTIRAPEIVIYGEVRDAAGRPLPGATIDVWQTDEKGAYDLQLAGGAEADMRGRFRCDREGRYHLRTIRPLGYSIPMDGPVGRLVRRQNRHGFRPSHIHMLVGAPGHREAVTALYMADDEHIDSDTVFGVSRALVVSPAADDPASPIPGLPAIRYDFTLAPAAGDDTGRVGADPSQIVAAAG